MQKRLVCVTGPTASGKTALSIALAQKLNTEIISADSMQIYRGMDIGTAKPTLKEQQGIVHHMIDVVEPEEDFSVARYVQMADPIVQSLLQEGKTPVIAGGTGLYLDALLSGNTFSGEESNLAIREKYLKMAKEQGNLAVHDCLRAVDPQGAARLHPNNLKRVIRALEVWEQTGMTLDALNAKNRTLMPRYDAIKIGLCPAEREVLYERIHQRIDGMMEMGLLEEVQRFFAQGKLCGTAGQAIGYKEFLPYLQGTADLESCVALLKQHTRNYAKRQLTWLRRDSTITWFYYTADMDFTSLLQRSTDFLEQQGIQ